MNHTTADCSFDSSFGKQFLTNFQRFNLILINSILLIANVFTNALVIYLLVKTKQFSNYSMKFMLLLATSDILTAATVQTIQILSLPVPLETLCSISVLEPFFTAVMPRISLYTILIIGLDRYIRVRYTLNFRIILTSTGAYILMIGVCRLSVVNGSLNTVGAYYDGHMGNVLTGMTGFIDITLFLFVIALQMRTMCIMKTRVADAENPEVLDETSTKIIKLSSRIMILFIICVIPFNVVLYIRIALDNYIKSSTRSYLEFFVRFTLFGNYLNGIGNAILFLQANELSKEYLRLIFKNLQSCGNTIVPAA